MLNVAIKSRYTDTKSGYVQLYLADGSVVEEHRYIMTQFLERELVYNEIVHHIDENKQNNLLENLEVKSRSAHAREHGLERGRQPHKKLACSFCSGEFELNMATYKCKVKMGQVYFCCSRSHQTSLQQKLKKESKAAPQVT